MVITNKLSITYSAVMPSGERAVKTAESNAVGTEILSYSVTRSLSCDKTAVFEGEAFRNTVVVTNTSAAALTDIRLSVPSVDGASFVVGSVKINGVAQPSFDPFNGFALPDLAAGGKAVIEYELRAVGPITLSPLTHSATIDYSVADPVRGGVRYSENTNTVSVNVVADNISIVKSVDRAYAVRGESLHYTAVVTNNGGMAKSGLVFRDPIPVGTTFVANSVKLNGIGYSVYDPETGFVLRGLAAGEAVTVEFDVTVD